MANDSGIWREAMDERRPDYVLAIRAQALDRVQDLIEPYENDDVPPVDVWRKIVDAAFPPPPIAATTSDDPVRYAERPYQPLHTEDSLNPDGFDRIIVKFAPQDRSGFVSGVCLLGCAHDCPADCPCECHRHHQMTVDG